MRNYGQLYVVAGTALILLACTNTYNTINNQGGISGNVIFPKREDANISKGVTVSVDEVDRVVVGVTKKDLYRTIGRPHFSEINGAVEWNYILNFRDDIQTVKSCLFKVIFDKNEVVTSLYWQPKNCYTSIKGDM